MTAVTWDEAAMLRERGLMPPEIGGWFEDPPSRVDLGDRYRGVMLGMGVGEALARPARGLTADDIEARFGVLNRFLTRPLPEWLLPPGQLGDDTQLALLVTATLVAKGRIDPHDLAQRLSAWLPVARTPGQSTKTAVQALRNGAPWLRSGQPSATNGAMVRAIPVGLANPHDLDSLRREAAVSTVVTHTDGAAVAAAAGVAGAIAHLTRTPDGRFRPSALRDAILQALDGIDDDVRIGEGSARLGERIDQAFATLGRSPKEALGLLGTGRPVVESLPTALWLFASHAEDPVAATVGAAHAGGEADTIGAIVGAFSGAYRGARSFPAQWVDHLEYADGLAGMADALLELSGSGTCDDLLPVRHPLHPASYRPFRLGGMEVPTLEHAIRSTQPADPAASVRVRLLPTPADARRYASTVPARPDWETAATGTVSAVLARRFPEHHADSTLLARTTDDVLESMATVFTPDDPFDYPVLLAVRRGEIAFGE